MGASGDIGEACVKALAKSGWSVVCHYHKSFEKVQKLVSKLRLIYSAQDFFMLSLNMLDEAKIKDFISELFSIDAVIFASGFSYYKLVNQYTSQELEELWQIHLKTPILLLSVLQDKLSLSKAGRVVFIGSVYGEIGSSMEAVYSAVKAGQVAFVKSYAKEVATLGINVNVVAPGAINTKMNRFFTDKELKKLNEQIPLGRMGEPIEIAAVVNFLVSDSASYLTGSVIPVTGGWY